jgi:hypothetical protein
MALGAKRRDVLRLVLGQGLRLAAIGTSAGLIASFGAMRLIARTACSRGRNHFELVTTVTDFRDGDCQPLAGC